MSTSSSSKTVQPGSSPPRMSGRIVLNLCRCTTTPDALKVPVTKPIGVGPYTDQWGIFVSGFAPAYTGSNETVMVLCVDFGNTSHHFPSF